MGRVDVMSCKAGCPAMTYNANHTLEPNPDKTTKLKAIKSASLKGRSFGAIYWRSATNIQMALCLLLIYENDDIAELTSDQWVERFLTAQSQQQSWRYI